MKTILHSLDIQPKNPSTYIGHRTSTNDAAQIISSTSPINGTPIASVEVTSKKQYQEVVSAAKDAFKIWRSVPAPKRGDTVRLVGNQLREKKEDLATLLSYEMGKSYQEALGEIQEMIDICDFATGLSRQLYGLTMHSERFEHRLYEQWQPLGVVGIISAFNFPAAVWSWNAMLALVCGDVCIWKPSEKTPLIAIACQHIIAKTLKECDLPGGISCLVNGGSKVGEWIAEDSEIALVSATGSTDMGRKVAASVGKRLGKSLLELGGNNAIIISPSADLANCLPPIIFGCIGTAGQRCTTTRRLIIHKSIYNEVKEKLVAAYRQIKIGSPLDESNHMGPLIDQQAVDDYLKAIGQCKEEGGNLLIEGRQLRDKAYQGGYYVSPSLAEIENNASCAQTETFAPLLYLIKYDTIEEAIEIQNNVPQGLSSAIMSLNLHETELFLSERGSDCGIANVNIGTSGAEIGGAFGGEKETGGGRESGGDAWKNYMRRQTVTINRSEERASLSQGIKFKL